MMRVLAMVPALYGTSPGQRFRLEQWESALNEAGIRIEWHSFECERLHAVLYKGGGALEKARLTMKAFARRLLLLKRIDDYDLVYVFREAALLGPPVIEKRLARTGKPLVFDFDDAVWVPYVSPSNRYLSLLKFPGKTRMICRMASHVMAGNAYLANYAREVSSRVTIIPTTIDTDSYQPADRDGRVGKDPTLGWTGSYSTVQHLDTLRPSLRRLAAERRFRLRVIGTPSYEGDGYPVDAMQWRADTEVEDLRPIDVGVMPLPDDRWSRGKCGLKALQYMALGIPTICSPVGVNSEIIVDGENGMLAGSDDEWVVKMGQLLSSPSLRGEIGATGRRTVEERFSSKVQAPRVAALLGDLVTGAVRPPRERSLAGV